MRKTTQTTSGWTPTRRRRRRKMTGSVVVAGHSALLLLARYNYKIYCLSFHPPPPVLAQVDSEKVDVDVAEHLHQAYRLVSILSA